VAQDLSQGALRAKSTLPRGPKWREPEGDSGSRGPAANQGGENGAPFFNSLLGGGHEACPLHDRGLVLGVRLGSRVARIVRVGPVLIF
jgi:hypothetical protein